MFLGLFVAAAIMVTTFAGVGCQLKDMSPNECGEAYANTDKLTIVYEYPNSPKN